MESDLSLLLEQFFLEIAPIPELTDKKVSRKMERTWAKPWKRT